MWACPVDTPPCAQIWPEDFAEAVRGLNKVLVRHQPSGCVSFLAAAFCPCSLGLTALLCQRQNHAAYAEGMLYLTALNTQPVWRRYRMTWSLERVRFSMHVRPWNRHATVLSHGYIAHALTSYCSWCAAADSIEPGNCVGRGT